MNYGKTIVCGSRTITDYKTVKSYLDHVINDLDMIPTHIISGCAKGVDTLAIRYAHEKGIPTIEVPAKWDLYGKSAGFKRNKEMLEIANAVIALWDGKSKGTENTIELAHEKGIPAAVFIIKQK